MENGFNPISAQCQVIIADGLKGTEYREIEIGGEYCQAPKIGAAIADADIIVTMNHFKGHEQAGFGGALKNLGMGCASVGGKLELHSASQPVIDSQNCKKCGICIKHCAHEAIHFDAQPYCRNRLFTLCRLWSMRGTLSIRCRRDGRKRHFRTPEL